MISFKYELSRCVCEFYCLRRLGISFLEFNKVPFSAVFAAAEVVVSDKNAVPELLFMTSDLLHDANEHRIAASVMIIAVFFMMISPLGFVVGLVLKGLS